MEPKQQFEAKSADLRSCGTCSLRSAWPPRPAAPAQTPWTATHAECSVHAQTTQSQPVTFDDRFRANAGQGVRGLVALTVPLQ